MARRAANRKYEEADYAIWKELRERGLNDREIGEECGVPRTVIAKWRLLNGIDSTRSEYIDRLKMEKKRIYGKSVEEKAEIERAMKGSRKECKDCIHYKEVRCKPYREVLVLNCEDWYPDLKVMKDRNY